MFLKQFVDKFVDQASSEIVDNVLVITTRPVENSVLFTRITPYAQDIIRQIFRAPIRERVGEDRLSQISAAAHNDTKYEEQYAGDGGGEHGVWKGALEDEHPEVER